MKTPLESNHAEQTALAGKDTLQAEVGVDEGRSETKGGSAGQLDRAYPWLLALMSCLSAVLCWMYITKPVIIQSSDATQDQSAKMNAITDTDASETTPAAVNQTASRAGEPQRELVPSDKNLPGSNPSQPGGDTVAGSQDPASTEGSAGLVAVDPGMLTKADGGDSGAEIGLGWETTNLKVQHILSADPGNGELQKIVIDVPVLYETRTMRWTPQDIAKARKVMGRLMIYERNLNSLRKEGQAILMDWNGLLGDTVPTPALRADSPSLPYNHGPAGQAGALPDSSSLIKVER